MHRHREAGRSRHQSACVKMCQREVTRSTVRRRREKRSLENGFLWYLTGCTCCGNEMCCASEPPLLLGYTRKISPRGARPTLAATAVTAYSIGVFGRFVCPGSSAASAAALLRMCRICCACCIFCCFFCGAVTLLLLLNSCLRSRIPRPPCRSWRCVGFRARPQDRPCNSGSQV